MKVTIKSYHAIATWSWNLKPNSNPDDSNTDASGANNNEDDDDEEEDVCGICRIAFDGCCHDCKIPGDDCPLIWGECTHVFHMHCLLKWLGTSGSKQQCPMDRRPWVNAEQRANPPSTPATAQNNPNSTNAPVATALI